MATMSEGKLRFYCGGCRRDRDGARRERDYQPYEPDMEAVKRAVYGDPPEYLRPAERRLAAEEIYAVPLPRRLSLSVSAQHLRCTPRHVSWLFKKIKEAKEG